MTREELITLYYAVSLIESGGNPLVFRFEPGFMNKIQDGDRALTRVGRFFTGFMTKESKKAFLSFSVGRVQIMIYNLFFYDSLFEYIVSEGITPSIPLALDSSRELELFKRLLEAKEIDYFPSDKEEFERWGYRWNGSKEYAKKLIKVLKNEGR